MTFAFYVNRSDGRFRGRSVTQIRYIALIVIVMFPVCILCVTLGIMCNLLGSDVTNVCALSVVCCLRPPESVYPCQPRAVSHYCTETVVNLTRQTSVVKVVVVFFYIPNKSLLILV